MLLSHDERELDSLPRIPDVQTAEDFDAKIDAGIDEDDGDGEHGNARYGLLGKVRRFTPEKRMELERRFQAVEMSQTQVNKTPSWPRSWANSSLLQLYSHRNAWANLHPQAQPNTFHATEAVRRILRARADGAARVLQVDEYDRGAEQGATDKGFRGLT